MGSTASDDFLSDDDAVCVEPCPLVRRDGLKEARAVVGVRERVVELLEEQERVRAESLHHPLDGLVRAPCRTLRDGCVDVHDLLGLFKERQSKRVVAGLGLAVLTPAAMASIEQ